MEGNASLIFKKDTEVKQGLTSVWLLLITLLLILILIK